MKSPDRLTLDWIANFVIHHGLCPFAARPFSEGTIATLTCPSQDPEQIFYWAGAQVQWLLERTPAEVETSLLVIPDGLADFQDFLAMVEALEELLDESGADTMVQLAHFHPAYTFAGVPSNDAANATNRSPHPTIQLLRVASVTAAVEHYPDVGDIPVRNARLLRSLFDEGAAGPTPVGGDD